MTLPADYCLVLCTCPDRASAENLARSVVEAQLAACVNLLPGLTSIYRWQDAIEQAEETLLLIKTQQAVYPGLEAYLKRHHPYQVPEIIALPLVAGSSDYLNWIRTCLRFAA